MILYLLNTRMYVNDITYTIISIPRVATQYYFVLLAIDRVVGVAFPYRYRNIMKLRVVYALIASMWIIAAVLSLLARIFEAPYMVWPFGIFIPQSGGPSAFTLYLLPQVVSAILIVGTIVYLYRSIIQSKKKLENNLKLSGTDQNKITKLQQLIHNLQMQLESSLPVFVLGGIDCLINVLRVVIFIFINSFSPLSSGASVGMYFYQFLVTPLVYCQIISHCVTYGIYKKEVRKILHRYYQPLQRLLPPCPSKVITLQPR